MFIVGKDSSKDTRGGVRQRTLKSAIGCTGIGLHCGMRVGMTLHPAEPDTGIVFRRSDIAAKGAVIPALWSHVVDTRLCTVIGNEDRVVVGTVEHLLAAFSGIGIDNAVVEINGPEVPVMDGSAAPFVFLMECAGICEQNARRRILRVHKKVQVREGDKCAVLYPTGGGFSVGCEISFPSRAVARQSHGVTVSPSVFTAEISRARTFGFLEEVAQMRAAGLARGGALDNAIVISGDRILNEEGLRFDNEFVRHKILDAIGDLYLAGRPMIGHFHGYCSGHALNNRLLRTLLADGDAWSEEEMTPADLVPFQRWPEETVLSA
ncbi:MAG: UDP-3-O-3-hydroxymyristoyl N-acetylglucosamine deacetylase [Rhodospirillaceae bacterium]|nr:MAG: UDP-3-O-3-hydroxymyristoyl N-acetylglucosamine deacetylase [Rhodospirillaceae bacterium]